MPGYAGGQVPHKPYIKRNLMNFATLPSSKGPGYRQAGTDRERLGRTETEIGRDRQTERRSQRLIDADRAGGGGRRDQGGQEYSTPV